MRNEMMAGAMLSMVSMFDVCWKSSVKEVGRTRRLAVVYEDTYERLR